MHASRPEHFVQPGKRLGSPGQHHDAAYRTVQTVRHSKEDTAGLGITHCDEGFVKVRKRLVFGLVSLYDLPRPLVHYKQMVVFVQNALFCVVKARQS